MQVPVLTTSEECLACRGCCVFAQPHTDWAPRLTNQDTAALKAFRPDGKWMDKETRIALKPGAHGYACSFLDEKTHHCAAYEVRPFECRLYPFLLSAEDGRVVLLAHLGCPAVRDRINTPVWPKHVARLRGFFQSDEIRGWVRQEAQRWADYRAFRDECRYVLDVVDSRDMDAGLCSSVEAWVSKREQIVSSVNFSQVFTWQDFFSFSREEVDDNLLVFARQPLGCFLYWPPQGAQISPKALRYAADLMRTENSVEGVSRVENVGRHECEAFPPELFTPVLRGYEYCYFRKDIAELRGNGYKSQRAEINALLRAQEPVYRAFCQDDVVSCIALFDRWAAFRRGKNADPVYGAMIEENRAVHGRMMRCAAALGLVGRIVEIKGNVVAYTFGYVLSKDTFCVLAEVSDPLIKGLAPFIFRAFCADPALQKFVFINAMDDFAMPNVAAAKLSYRPAYLEPVYTMTLKE